MNAAECAAKSFWIVSLRAFPFHFSAGLQAKPPKLYVICDKSVFC